MIQAREWRSLPLTVRRLILIRLIRSVAQGALAADFAIYLHVLGWTSIAIGGALTLTGLSNTALAFVSGPISDRFGRKSLLLPYEAVVSLCALALVFFHASPVILLCGMVGNVGRGANGAAGPFSPVELAWVSEELSPEARTKAFAWNSSAGFFGMALGALLASCPTWLEPILGPTTSYLPIFVLAALSNLTCLLILFGLKEVRQALRGDRKSATVGPLVTAEEKKGLLTVAAMNALNSAGVGLAGPLMPYWFFLRFHASPAEIGPMQAVAFVGTGIASIVQGRIAHRFGIVNATVASRSLGLLFGLAIPFAPTFLAGAIFYTLRSVVNRGTVGIRQALTAGSVRDGNHGAAFSIGNSASQLPMAIGPSIAGAFLSAGMLQIPLVLGVGLQAGYLALFPKAFRQFEPQQRHRGSRGRKESNETG